VLKATKEENVLSDWNLLETETQHKLQHKFLLFVFTLTKHSNVADSMVWTEADLHA